ncbi:MAG: universal stress protein [Actinomycetota bacterium]|nr:universal stress protein [Actinomycetota bacterium]
MPVYETILVGTDGSETAQLAVDRAADLAATFGARLVMVSAFHPAPETRVEAERRGAPEDIVWAINGKEEVDKTLAEAKHRAEGKGAGDIVTMAVEGSASDVLLDIADKVEASVIVVGSVGLTGAKRFLMGSVPSRVTHYATIDVLVVRTDRSDRTG